MCVVCIYLDYFGFLEVLRLSTNRVIQHLTIVSPFQGIDKQKMFKPKCGDKICNFHDAKLKTKPPPSGLRYVVHGVLPQLVWPLRPPGLSHWA